MTLARGLLAARLGLTGLAFRDLFCSPGLTAT